VNVHVDVNVNVTRVRPTARIRRLQSPFRITVIGRLKDHKMRAKLLPLLAMPEIRDIALVRRTPLDLPRVRNYCPPPVLREIAPIAEAWRLVTLLWLCLSGRAGSFLVSFYLLPHGLYADLARRLFGLPTIPVTISEEDVKLGLSRWPYAGALAAAHAVGVRGAHSARLLEAQGIPRGRIFNPPNLYDPDTCGPDASVVKDIDILYVGNLVAVKRLDRLLEAVAHLVKARPALRVVLVGDGVLRGELEARAAGLHLGAHVEFVGARPFEEIPQWLRRARVFVMTSEMEGLPQAMIEAMGCGVPVVLPDTGDVTTIAKHGENAWIVSPPTAEGFAGAVTRLLDDPALYRRLSDGCLALREQFRRDYGLEGAMMEWRNAFAPKVP
jgi:glycosyltransferase involved in cell wall biosynthesis